MKIKIPDDKFLEAAKLLTEVEAEQVLSRMRGKLYRRFEDKRLSMTEALAIQLEIEDEQLQEWRARMIELRKKYAD
jgi:hypothetical protein